MEITFLGTAAAEGYPAPFCRCENCEEARRRRGRSLRLRSSVLINNDLLVDFSDIIAASSFYGIDLSCVETLLITHPHADHLCAEQFFLHAYPFARTDVPGLDVYGSREAIDAIHERCETSLEQCNVETHVVHAGDTWTTGRYGIHAFCATHGTEEPLLYAIDDGECSLLYSTDTGRYCPETWEAIKTHSYDIVIMDETMGTIPTSASSLHMGIDAVVEYRQAFEAEGLLRPGARFIAHHFSHGANPCYEQLVEMLEPYGVGVAHDGWRVQP